MVRGQEEPASAREISQLVLVLFFFLRVVSPRKV